MLNNLSRLQLLALTLFTLGKLSGLFALVLVMSLFFSPALKAAAIGAIVAYGALIFACISICLIEHYNSRKNTNKSVDEAINDPEVRAMFIERLKEFN